MPDDSREEQFADPHPIRTALGLLRGAKWLEREGADPDAVRQLRLRAIRRLNREVQDLNREVTAAISERAIAASHDRRAMLQDLLKKFRSEDDA